MQTTLAATLSENTSANTTANALTPQRGFSLSAHVRPSEFPPAPRASYTGNLAQMQSPIISRPPARSATPVGRDVSSRFGARLRELRRERNLTQLRMATEFGIDRSFISDVERGRKSISLPMLEVIALGMKLSLSDLLQDI